MLQKSLFVEFFGDYPFIRVLDFLLENEIFDYSKKEICKHTGVSWNTLETFWDKMEEKKVVVKSRKIGKSYLFKINLENPVVQKLMELDKKLMLDSIENMKEEKIPVTRQRSLASRT